MNLDGESSIRSQKLEMYYLHKIFRVCTSFHSEHVLRWEHGMGCIGGGREWRGYRELWGSEIGINTTECLSHKSNSHLDNGEERDPLFTLWPLSEKVCYKIRDGREKTITSCIHCCQISFWIKWMTVDDSSGRCTLLCLRLASHRSYEGREGVIVWVNEWRTPPPPPNQASESCWLEWRVATVISRLRVRLEYSYFILKVWDLTVLLGEYLELREWQWHEAAEKCIKRRFIMCALRHLLLGWTSERRCYW